MSDLFTRSFAVSTLERAAKTSAQTLAAMLVASGSGLIDAPWWASLSAAGMAGVISVLTSVGSGAATGGGPSLTNSEIPAGAVAAKEASADDPMVEPGEYIAGPAADVPEDTPVEVKPAGPKHTLGE